MEVSKTQNLVQQLHIMSNGYLVTRYYMKNVYFQNPSTSDGIANWIKLATAQVMLIYHLKNFQKWELNVNVVHRTYCHLFTLFTLNIKNSYQVYLLKILGKTSRHVKKYCIQNRRISLVGKVKMQIFYRI